MLWFSFSVSHFNNSFFFSALSVFPSYFMFLFSLPSQILVCHFIVQFPFSLFIFFLTCNHSPMHWLWLSPITKALLSQQHLRHKLWLNYCNSTLWEAAGGSATFTCAYVSQEVNLLLTLVSPLYLKTLWPALAAVRTCAGTAFVRQSPPHTWPLCNACVKVKGGRCSVVTQRQHHHE